MIEEDLSIELGEHTRHSTSDTEPPGDGLVGRAHLTEMAESRIAFGSRL
jgi:hypothetical protein